MVVGAVMVGLLINPKVTTASTPAYFSEKSLDKAIEMVPGAGPGDTATGPLAVVGAVEAVRSTNAKDTSAVTPAWCSEKSLAKVTAVDGPLPVMVRGLSVLSTVPKVTTD